jgi:predicted transcriptional regulator
MTGVERRQLMAISDKALAQEVLDQQPEDAPFDDIMYALYVRKKIERGLQDAQAGNLIDHEDVMREVDEWLESAGRV